MNKRRTHIVIPGELAAAIDAFAGRRGRSKFLVDLARREVLRLQQLRALDRAEGCWKDKDHPELREGAARWVAKVRRESERRFRRVTAR